MSGMEKRLVDFSRDWWNIKGKGHDALTLKMARSKVNSNHQYFDLLTGNGGKKKKRISGLISFLFCKSML